MPNGHRLQTETLHVRFHQIGQQRRELDDANAVCRGGIVVEPPTQAFVKLLGSLDVGYWNDVDLELHVDFRCAAIILLLFRAGACLTHMHWLTFLSFVVSLICSCWRLKLERTDWSV